MVIGHTTPQLRRQANNQQWMDFLPRDLRPATQESKTQRVSTRNCAYAYKCNLIGICITTCGGTGNLGSCQWEVGNQHKTWGSKNRIAGTMVWQNENVTWDVYRRLLVQQLLSSIQRLWPYGEWMTRQLQVEPRTTEQRCAGKAFIVFNHQTAQKMLLRQEIPLCVYAFLKVHVLKHLDGGSYLDRISKSKYEKRQCWECIVNGQNLLRNFFLH